MFQDGLFVGDGHAEPANSEFRHGFQKIPKILDQEGQVYGIDFACDEARIMKERRQGVPDRITDYAVDASSLGELVGPVEIFQVVQGNLAGGSSFADRRVRQRAAFSQSEDTRWQTDLTHGHSDE